MKSLELKQETVHVSRHSMTGVLIFLLVCLLFCMSSKSEAQPRRSRQPDKAPKVGEMAPTFKLKSLDAKSETDLASFKGKKPVVLFFGSYT